LKRNTVRVLGGLALALALATGTTACGSTEAPSNQGGGSSTQCKGKIGFFGALSGGNASVVIPSRDGAKLAFDKFKQENPNCNVEMVEFDTEGEPAKAAPVANQIASNQDFLGVIGGAFSGETRQTKKTYDEAGVTMISASATATDLTAKDQAKVFHRVVGYDEVQGAAIARYVKGVLKATKAFAVDDSTTYGGPLCDKVKADLGSVVASFDKVQEKQTDFAATVSKIKAAAPDAVVYCGYANEAGPFLQQLRAAGVTAKFVGGDGLYGADFPKAAGPQAEGAVVTCPCLPAEKAKGTFAKDFKDKMGQDPGAYAAEGYDAANVFLEAFKAGKTTRKDVLDFVNAYDKDGVTKHIKFDSKGDIETSLVTIWAYVIKNGALVAEQEVPKA
jgi:branched-chain amino acid transport system substrate-binding protein